MKPKAKPKTGKRRTFACAQCKGTFRMEWTDDEAKAESRGLFGNVPSKDLVIICDDCFQRTRQ